MASFPNPSILWLYLIGSYKPVYSPHCHLHFLSHRDTTYPIESNRFSLLTNVRNTNPCCSPTIFRINRERGASSRSVTFFFATRVVREKSSVGSECAQLTNHSVGRPMYYIDEASGGVLRERDSQVTGFHSSHSSRNLWSHWKWIEWNLVCLKR